MLVRCNKHHICTEEKYYCFHAQWHKYSPRCNNGCVILKNINPDDIRADCIEQEQEFISKEDMILC